MTWASIIKAVLEFLNGLFAAVRQAKDEDLGRLKERERQDAASDDLRAAIDRANADSVSDDEAFGAGGRDNNLPGPLKG